MKLHEIEYNVKEVCDENQRTIKCKIRFQQPFIGSLIYL